MRIWISMRSPVRADHRGVQRLVEVRLRQRDVVLEAAGDRRPRRVRDAERLVAVHLRVGDHAEADRVVDLLERRAACASSSGRSTTGAWRGPITSQGTPFSVISFWISFSTSWMYSSRSRARLRDLGRELLVLAGVEVLEREVLELDLDPLDAEAVRERRVDLHRLGGDALLLLGRQVLERPHVVEAVARA